MGKIKFIIGITGGSGVGKTTLIKSLYDKFEGRVSTFSLDNYYLPKEEQAKDENGVINFDLPTGLDQKAIKIDLGELIQGNSIRQSIYGFNNPKIASDYNEIIPNDLLIVEGLFVIHYPFVREVLDYTSYLCVDECLQLERILIRDVNERNYTKEDVLYQWDNHVKPSYNNFVKPYKKDVDLIITNNEAFDENIHILTSVIHDNID